MRVTIQLLTVGFPDQSHARVADELKRRGLPFRVDLEPSCVDPELVVHHLDVDTPVLHEKGADNILGCMDKLQALVNAYPI